MSSFGCSSRALAVSLLAAFLTGCSSTPQSGVPTEYAENLALILTAYSEATQKLQRPPNNMGELKPYLQKLGTPEKMLVSPHDGQPYEIRWGVDPQQLVADDPADPQSPLIVHERTGVNGTRYVATGMGVFRMSDADFERARKQARKR